MLYGTGSRYFTRVIIVHPVNVRPYLYFLCADGSADERCSIVAAAPFQVVRFIISIFADIPLSNKKIDAGILCPLRLQFFLYIFQVRFSFRSGTHKVESGEQDIGNLSFPQVEVQQGCTDKFSLCQYLFFFNRGEFIIDKLPESLEAVENIIYCFSLCGLVCQQFVGEVNELEFHPGDFLVCLLYIAVEQVGCNFFQMIGCACRCGQDYNLRCGL